MRSHVLVAALLGCGVGVLSAGCAPTTTIDTPWGTYTSGKDVGLIVEFKLDPETGQPAEVYVEATGLATPVVRAQAQAWDALAVFLQQAARVPAPIPAPVPITGP
jgi:hypothetical protein